MYKMRPRADPEDGRC